MIVWVFKCNPRYTNVTCEADDAKVAEFFDSFAFEACYVDENVDFNIYEGKPIRKNYGVISISQFSLEWEKNHFSKVRYNEIVDFKDLV